MKKTPKNSQCNNYFEKKKTLNYKDIFKYSKCLEELSLERFYWYVTSGYIAFARFQPLLVN